MRVLHFYKTSFPDTMGGVEQVIHLLASGAVKLGVETKVLSLTPHQAPRHIDIDGYQVYRARTDIHIASTSISGSALVRFVQLAREADIIHYHFPWPYMDVVHFLSRVRKPALVTYHSDIVRQKGLLQIYRPLRRMFLRDMDRIVATSANYLATSNVLTKYHGKVEVIPIGLDRTKYPPPSEERLEFWRKRMGGRFFLFVGVIRYYKGLHILLNALHGTTLPVAIVGAGPIEKDLKEQARTLGLSSLHFLGHLPEEDKIALLHLCYAVVFPSHLRSEAFGISLLEGAMFGKPLISSEIGTGTTFINIDRQTGLVVPPSNPRALRDAMQDLWDHPDKSAEMGRNAEGRYWELFTADKMVHAYVNLYRDMLR